MNQRIFSTITLVVLVIVVGGILGYFAFSHRPRTPATDHMVQDGAVQDGAWKIYSKINPGFSYSFEYPRDWSVKEIGAGGETKTGAHFLPPEETSEHKSISLVIFNDPRVSSPLVGYTYTTLRKVQSDDGEILVQKREPGSEQYIVTLLQHSHIVEFRFSYGLDNKYDLVFDHMVSSFRSTYHAF